MVVVQLKNWVEVRRLAERSRTRGELGRKTRWSMAVRSLLLKLATWMFLPSVNRKVLRLCRLLSWASKNLLQRWVGRGGGGLYYLCCLPWTC